MRKKAKVYLETSVISMYYEEDAPLLREITREFWNVTLPKVNAYISDMTFIEIRATKDPVLQKRLVELISNFKVLPLTNDSRELAKTYLKYRRLPEPDAIHIAIASLGGMNFLVTWNLRHLIKPGTQYMVRQVNMKDGLPLPQIVTPEDFFEEE